MIRDPSDGSVREEPLSKHNEFNPQRKYPGSYSAAAECVIETTTSGLPITKGKAEYLARLNWSRDWLKSYFNPKGEQA